jgi:hypothetical protein
MIWVSARRVWTTVQVTPSSVERTICGVVVTGT